MRAGWESKHDGVPDRQGKLPLSDVCTDLHDVSCQRSIPAFVLHIETPAFIAARAPRLHHVARQVPQREHTRPIVAHRSPAARLIRASIAWLAGDNSRGFTGEFDGA